jgi:hypothetical protein
MSRWTRASIASSLLVLSAVAAGCEGAPRYDEHAVRAAFRTQGFRLAFAVGSQRGGSTRIIRPLDDIDVALRRAVSGSPPDVREPRSRLFYDAFKVDAAIYADDDDAAAAQREHDWIERHLAELRLEARRLGAPIDPSRSADVRFARRANVAVSYPPRLERRVDAALDGLR